MPMERRTIGHALYSLSSSRPRPETSACTFGGCAAIVIAESSVSARCTSIHASDGSSERTITQRTTAKKSAENFTGRCSVTADVRWRLSEIIRDDDTGATLLSRLGEQLGDDGAVGRAVPVRRPDDLLPDDAVACDHERLWYTGGLIVVHDLSRRIIENLEGQPELLHECANLLFEAGVVDADGDDLEPLRPHRLMQLLDRGHLIAARQAERAPDVEKHDLPLVIRKGLRARRRVDRRRMKLWRLRSYRHRIQLIAEHPRRGEERAAEYDDDQRDDRPLLARGHARSVQSARSAPISARGSGAANTAWPATKVSAPARHTSAIVSRLIPPSTSSIARLFVSVSRERARRTLFAEPAMNDCPPNPGFTVMISSRSSSAATSRTASIDVDGLSATPARHPTSRMRASCRFRCGAASA